REDEVLGVDARAQLVALNLQARPLERLLRLVALALGRSDAAPLLGFGLLDLRFGLLQLRTLGFERALLLSGVERDDDVARGDLRAVGGQIDDLQVAAGRRRGQDHRSHGRTSPRSCRKSMNVVFVTIAVGSDALPVSRRSAATAATDSATTNTTPRIAQAFFIAWLSRPCFHPVPRRCRWPRRDPASGADRCRRC